MSDWTAFLREHGASLDGAVATGFGDPSGELAAARDTAIVSDLAALTVLTVTGADTPAFLQGQLTNDVTQLADGASHFSAWCSPKGRVLVIFRVRRISAERFELLLPASLAEPTAKRLRMFVLRSKVEIAEAGDASIRLGVGGPAAAACIAASIGVTPALHHSMAIDGGSLIALPGNRFLIIAAPDKATMIWDMLERARPAGLACWQWLGVRAAVPEIGPPTQERFVPQMLNLDALDALSFAKGCYTGQEIVARTQHLGRLKERLALAHVDAAPPAPGTRLFASAFGDQPCGTVINAAAAPGGGADVLAVAQVAALSGEALRVDSADGLPVTLLPLPYALPASGERTGRMA
jgi:tRNA-modifying protein YgfZ